MLSFVELPGFSRAREQLLSDGAFLDLQAFLLEHPAAGDVIPRSGGCRKLRWADDGQGKRGGLRVVYFLRLNSGQVILVSLYAKSVQADIDPALLRKLKAAFDARP